MERTGSKPIDDIIQLAVDGNGFAFTALWDMYIGQLRAYIKSWLKNLDDLQVDDICSRSFEKAFRQIHNFDKTKSQFFTWLRIIAHNTALDLLDSEQRAHASEYLSLDDDTRELSVEDTVPDSIDSPLDSIIRTETEEATKVYIDGLPEIYRAVASLRMIDGLPYQQIALKTGLELNTVRTRIRRAKQIMDKKRKEDENGE